MSYQEMVEMLSSYLGDDLTELKQKVYAKEIRNVHDTWE
jgi:hypothetical protein